MNNDNNRNQAPLDVQFAPQSEVANTKEEAGVVENTVVDTTPEKKLTRREKKIAKMEEKLAREKAEQERERLAKLYPGSKNYAKKKKKWKKPLIIALVLVLLAAVGVVGFFHVKEYLRDDTYEEGEGREDDTGGKTGHETDDVIEDETSHETNAIIGDDVIGGKDDNITWTLEDGVLTISGNGDMFNYVLFEYRPWEYQLDSIRKIIIKDGITCIGNHSFSGCDNLTSISIPDSVTTIGAYAFDGCHNLTSVVIPDSVTCIKDHAFYMCINLTSITIPDSVTTIESYAFHACGNLQTIEVASDNKNYTSVDGVLFDKAISTLILYPIGNSKTHYILLDSVITIESHAFYGCDNLKNITIGDSVTTISDSAFRFCDSLTSITIPASVTSIGSYAFYYCSSLTDIYFGGTTAEWEAMNPAKMHIPSSATVHCSDGVA